MRARTGEDWQWLLVVAALPLFPVGALFHVPVTAMALLGGAHLIRSRGELRDDAGVRFIFWVFMALWVPQLVALPGTVAPDLSFRATAVYVAYPLAAIFMVRALPAGPAWPRLAAMAAVVVAVWGLDAATGATGLVEWPVERDDPRRIEGTLFARFAMGHVAAVLAPMLFELVRRYHRGRPWLWLVPVVTAALVLLSGRRVAWLMLLLAMGGYLTYLAWLTRPRPARLVLAGLLPWVLAAGLYWRHEPTRERVEITLALFTTDVEAVDLATSWRLDIWRTAFAAAAANPVNGVGTRGFRRVYADYASEDDFWLQEGREGALHPHLFALEVAAETGAPGVLGFALVWWLLWRRLRRSPAGRDGWAWPCGLMVAVAILPFNAHAAFYSSHWTAVTWWCIGLAAAATSARPQEPGPPPDRSGGARTLFGVGHERRTRTRFAGEGEPR